MRDILYIYPYTFLIFRTLNPVAMCARFIVHLHIFDFSHIKPCAMCTRIFAHLTLRARSFLAHLTPKFSIFLSGAKHLSLSVGRPPPPTEQCVLYHYM